MKTAVTVLQEMMIKLGKLPEYEYIAQSGPQHLPTFEYRCAALGVAVTARARSKQEAKQEAARQALRQLAARGHDVPPPYAAPAGEGADGGGAEAAAEAGGAAAAAAGPRSYVALLSELCVECGLPAPQYDLVGDTGPPHLRHFTVAARVAALHRLATATTKKAARQLAAQQLYAYLRENLTRHTADFVEEEALVRAHERVMDRYCELRTDPGRIDLGMRVADYHLALSARASPEARAEALRALDAHADAADGVRAALAALGVEASAHVADGEPPAHVVAAAAAPRLAWAAASPAGAARAAARYLRRALPPPDTQPPLDDPMTA